MLSEGIKRAIDCSAMLYNQKSNCPEDQRDAELRWVYRLAELAPDGIAVECGIRRGGSAVCWALARIGRGQVYGVDTKLRPSLSENLARYPDLDIKILNVGSALAPGLIEGEVAFAFIDADHSEAGVQADIAVWPDKVMPGGILAFHDYGVAKTSVGVKRVVDRWQAQTRWELLGQIGSLIAFRKPRKKQENDNFW